MSPELSIETEMRVQLLFPPDQVGEARKILRDECGNNLPFCENRDSIQMERLRFAALKLSEGNKDKLLRAVHLAQQDWRDLLVPAGFGNDVEAHRSWVPTLKRRT